MEDDGLVAVVKIALIFAIGGVICALFLNFFRDTNTEIIDTKTEVISEYDILKSHNENLLSGYESYDNSHYAMNITEDNYFVFFIKNNEGEIERITIPFDFKIVEQDIDTARLVMYRDINTLKVCEDFFDNVSCTEKEETVGEYYKLFVPYGIFDGSLTID